MMISVDGYFEGPNHDISWHNVDKESNSFAIEQLSEVDTILFGRRTYQLFEEYWPEAAKDPTISSENLQIANLINNVNKIVFSKTLHRVAEKDNWKNVKLIRDVNPAEIKRWKEQAGKAICVGGNNLCTNLARDGLVDEFRIMINPVVLGNGIPVFKGLEHRMNLRLEKTTKFASGNVLLTYRLNGGTTLRS
jgi:dihydrofolate reductase